MTPLQYALLRAVDCLSANRILQVHAYGLTKMLKDDPGERRWIGYGSQYRAMQQLVSAGYLMVQ